LTRKDQPFAWTDRYIIKLKKRLTSALVLVIPYIEKPFELYCDASHQGLSCVLMPEKEQLHMLQGNSKFMREIILLMT